ncbi:MAG: glycosyltransferase, partial [Candidatus Didemnitutus sp.]|nr:glycosyltransferase [Candidatus Didemnitutus sp.]
MRVLFATGSPAHYMAPPVLSEEQICCGPDWADVRRTDGRWLSVKTPVGEYDLARKVACLPQDQQPEVVVCLVDASWRHVPRNLSALRCPKILLVADTHHLRSPLVGMVQYATMERYDRVVLLYDYHHSVVFRSAGIKNLGWFPGLTFPHSDEVVLAARHARAKRNLGLAFIGQEGRFHPRRTKLLTALREAGLPVKTKVVSQLDALRSYGRSSVGFNASLNGDLNLRVFEIIAAGAALLTDRLSEEAGMNRLFADGRELATYGSADELLGLARDLLANPAKAEAIGEAGARWFDQNFAAAKRREDFKALVMDGRSPPWVDRAATPAAAPLFSGNPRSLAAATLVYEKVQEWHRNQEEVLFAIGAGVSGEVAALFSTLPRVRCVPATGILKAHLHVATWAEIRGTTINTPWLWCWDGVAQDPAALRALMKGAGFEGE